LGLDLVLSHSAFFSRHGGGVTTTLIFKTCDCPSTTSGIGIFYKSAKIVVLINGFSKWTLTLIPVQKKSGFHYSEIHIR
jgi:hypothetical protein